MALIDRRASFATLGGVIVGLAVTLGVVALLGDLPFATAEERASEATDPAPISGVLAEAVPEARACTPSPRGPKTGRWASIPASLLRMHPRPIRSRR